MKTINIVETDKNTDDLVEALITEMDKALPGLYLLEGYKMDCDELADLENLAQIRGTWDEDEFPTDLLVAAHADDLPERLAKAKEAVRERKVEVLRGAEILARQQGCHGLAYKLRDSWVELCKDAGGVDQMIAEGVPRWEGYALKFGGYEYELMPTGTGWKFLGQGRVLGETNCLDEDEAKFWAEGLIFGEDTDRSAWVKRLDYLRETDEEKMARAEAAIAKIIAKRHPKEEGNYKNTDDLVEPEVVVELSCSELIERLKTWGLYESVADLLGGYYYASTCGGAIIVVDKPIVIIADSTGWDRVHTSDLPAFASGWERPGKWKDQISAALEAEEGMEDEEEGL